MAHLRYFNRIFFVLISLFIITISGCLSSSKREANFNAEGEGELLNSTIMSFDSTKGYNMCHMVIDDKLIQYLVGDKYSYSVYNIKGDSLFYQGKFIMKGNGPYEMSVADIKYRPDKNELIIYSEDTYENDFYIIDLNNFNNLYDTRVWKRGKLPNLPTRHCFEFVNDSVYLHNSYTKSNSLFSLSYKGRDNYCHSLNMPYPQTKKETDLILQYSLFFGELVKHSLKPTFLYSNKGSKYVIIFDLDNEQITNVRYISDILPSYKPISDNPYQLFALNKESEGGCREVIVTDRYNLYWL